MLALVIGGAAAIEAIAFAVQLPRRTSVSPALLLAANYIAMGIGEHDRRALLLMAPRDQERTAGCDRIVENAALVADRRQRRRKLVFEIAAEIGAPLRVLTFGRNGNAARKIGRERATIEIGSGASDRRVAAA